MVGTKSRGYSNSGRLSEGEYSMPFFGTHHSPNRKLEIRLTHMVSLELPRCEKVEHKGQISEA